MFFYTTFLRTRGYVVNLICHKKIHRLKACKQCTYGDDSINANTGIYSTPCIFTSQSKVKWQKQDTGLNLVDILIRNATYF